MKNKTMLNLKKAKGFILIEVLAAALIGGIVLTVAMKLPLSMSKFLSVFDRRINLDLAAQRVTNQLQKDLEGNIAIDFMHITQVRQAISKMLKQSSPEPEPAVKKQAEDLSKASTVVTKDDVMQILKKSIKPYMLRSWTKIFSFAPNEQTTKMRFVTTAGLPLKRENYRRLVKVFYTLEPQENKTFKLYRAQSHNLHADFDDISEAETHLLLDNVESFNLEFLSTYPKDLAQFFIDEIKDDEQAATNQAEGKPKKSDEPTNPTPENNFWLAKIKHSSWPPPDNEYLEFIPPNYVKYTITFQQAEESRTCTGQICLPTSFLNLDNFLPNEKEHQEQLQQQSDLAQTNAKPTDTPEGASANA